MQRNEMRSLSLRTTDSAIALVSLIILTYVLYYRSILLGLIAVGLITTVYFGYTIGREKYAAGIFVVDVALILLLDALGIIFLPG